LASSKQENKSALFFGKAARSPEELPVSLTRISYLSFILGKKSYT
jgi:hypothetical protein